MKGEDHITGEIELEVVHIDTDREKDFNELLSRIMQAIDTFRDYADADDVAEVVERKATLALPEPTEVTIESQGSGRISVTVHPTDPENGDVMVVYDGNELVVYQGRESEPIIAQPDLQGARLASYVATILKMYYMTQIRNPV
jgi:hypothetical protein